MLRATGIILDDDGAGSNLAFHVSNPVLVEGDSGSQMAVFEVRLSRPAGQAFSVSYATADGSATAGTDYTATSGVLNFAAGQEVAFVSVAVSGDMVGEITESFDLIVTPPGSPAIGTAGAVGTATIMDDDSGAGPVVSITGSTVEENQFNFIRFTVSLSEAPVNSVTVDYNTVLGSASDADLFTNAASNSGTITFTAGETSQDVFVRLDGDAIDEIDETIHLVLSNPVGATLAGGATTLTATGFILDNDGPGLNHTLAGTPTEIVERPTNAAVHVVPVKLSQVAAGPMVFDVAVIGGTATAGQDFALIETTITFEAGQLETGITIEVFGDAAVEGAETVILGFTPQAGTVVAGPIANQTITIIDGPAFVPPLFTNGDDVVVLDDTGHRVNARAGNDIVRSGFGHDTLRGAAGNDILDGGKAADMLFGGTGFDTADYITAGSGVWADLILGGQSGDAAGDTYNSIEGIRGSNFDDDLRGNNLNNRLNGADGRDFLFARGGNDTLIGGGGIDTLAGDEGDDLLLGGGGNDRGFGGDGADTVNGDSGNDLLRGGTGDDRISGGTGADVIFGDGGDDFLLGEADNDRVDGGAGVDTMSGGAGDDTLLGGAGNDRGFGGDGADNVNGNDGDDFLRGGTGDDRVSGGAGADEVHGDGGDDNLLGFGGNDTLYGGAGNDLVGGSFGNDSLFGEAGNDNLFGGEANDTIDGGMGADLIFGQAGADLLTGGAGNDRFVFQSVDDSTAGARDTITDFAAGDRVNLISIDADTGTGGNQAFAFIGSALFTGTAGELRFATNGVDGFVTGDVDGDGGQDFVIHLAGVTAMSAGDFFL